MRIRAAPFRLLPTPSRVSDVRVSFRLATRARFVLRLPRACFVSETRAARCVRPTSASHYFSRLRAPVSRRFSIRVGATRAPRVSRAKVLHGTPSASAGRVLLSSFRRIVGRSLPRARRATVPLALPSPRPPCSFSKGATRARPRPLLPDRRVKAAVLHDPKCLPSPGIRALLPNTLAGSGHRHDPSHDARLVDVRAPLLVSVSLAPPRGLPLSVAGSARRALGPVRLDLVRFRKRRSRLLWTVGDARRLLQPDTTHGHIPRAADPRPCLTREPRSSRSPPPRSRVSTAAARESPTHGPSAPARLSPCLRDRTGIPGEERATRPALAVGRDPRFTPNERAGSSERRTGRVRPVPLLCFRSRAPGSPCRAVSQGLEAPCFVRDAGLDRRPPPPRERRRFRGDRGAFHHPGIPSSRDVFRLFAIRTVSGGTEEDRSCFDSARDLPSFTPPFTLP